MTIGWGYEKRWIEWFIIPIASAFIRDYYLQYTNFLNLSNKESVVVSPVVTVHTLGKNGDIKTVSVLTKYPSSLVLRRNLN